MKRHIWIACAVLAGTALLAGCATRIAPDDPINQKIDNLQQQVAQLKKTMSGQGIMDIASNQQQLQQEVSDLQGQIQELQHEMQQARARQQNVDKSFDQRIAALEQGASAVGVSSGGGGSSQAPEGETSGSASSTGGGGAGGGASQSDYDAYKAAFDEIKNNQYDKAVEDFKDFIQKYPNSRFVSNAMYWMGAAYYVNGKYEKAIDNFQQVVAKYPKSAKASDAYLKMAYSQNKLQDYKAERETLETLIKKYPGSTAADVANQLLQKMKSQGH